jgi:aspartate racemase
MQKAGIVGGTGPESTIDYYKSIINKFQKKAKSKEILPELFLKSIDMYKMFSFINAAKKEELIDYLSNAVQELKRAGSDFAVMAANTPHIVFHEVQQKVDIPMISIVEETYKRAEECGLQKLGLLGTKFTMENDFFKIPFEENGKEIIVPTEEEQAYIHEKINAELEYGIVVEETKNEFLTIISNLNQRSGIDGVILGCTELPMLIKEKDLTIPSLDTMEIHVEAIVAAMFESD